MCLKRNDKSIPEQLQPSPGGKCRAPSSVLENTAVNTSILRILRIHRMPNCWSLDCEKCIKGTASPTFILRRCKDLCYSVSVSIAQPETTK